MMKRGYFDGKPNFVRYILIFHSMLCLYKVNPNSPKKSHGELEYEAIRCGIYQSDFLSPQWYFVWPWILLQSIKASTIPSQTWHIVEMYIESYNVDWRRQLYTKDESQLRSSSPSNLSGICIWIWKVSYSEKNHGNQHLRHSRPLYTFDTME